MTTHEVLVAARNLIDREGHVQHRFGMVGLGWCARGAMLRPVQAVDADGQSCSFAAELREPLKCAEIALAREVPRTFMPARVGSSLRQSIGEEWANAMERVVAWNNAPERTKEEVLAAFDKAIAATSPQPPFETLQAEATERAPGLVTTS